MSHLCLLDAFQFLLLRELPLLAGDAIGLLSYFQRVLLQLNATYSRIFTKWLITNTFSYQYLENLRFYGTFPIPAPEVCTFSASSCFWAKVFPPPTKSKQNFSPYNLMSGIAKDSYKQHTYFTAQTSWRPLHFTKLLKFSLHLSLGQRHRWTVPVLQAPQLS